MKALCRQSLGVHQKTRRCLFENHASRGWCRADMRISDDKGQAKEALKIQTPITDAINKAKEWKDKTTQMCLPE